MYLKEWSNLLLPNYVKLAGSRSIAQQRNSIIIHNMKSFDAGTQDRLNTGHADILMSIKMSHTRFKWVFLRVNDGKALQIKGFITEDKTCLPFFFLIHTSVNAETFWCSSVWKCKVCPSCQTKTGSRVLARTFLKDLGGAVLSWLPDPVTQFDISHQAQLDGWQDSLGRKCHDAKRIS